MSDMVLGKGFGSAWGGSLDTVRRKTRRIAKRMLDMAFSTIFLILSAPVFMIIAFAIRCSSKGPVFYTQERVGHKGRVFKIIKFRTMRPTVSDKEHVEYVRSLLKNNAADGESSAAVEQYMAYLDRRITSVGRFLRATSMDELPQFINILLGHMSLVGPRPHPVYEVDTYKKWYCRRLDVKPGLTGWSKLNLRLTPKNYEEAILYDLWYVDHWTVSLDLKILFMTVPVVLAMKDAH